jgi:hypothetical protein
MGQAKKQLEAIEERGWRDIGKHVCQICVGHNYLAKFLKNSYSQYGCDYCKNQRRKSASVNVIMPAVQTGIRYGFIDAASADLSHDQEYENSLLSTNEVLEETLSSENVDWPPQLINDVADSFVSIEWMPRVYSDSISHEMPGSYSHAQFRWSWKDFSQVVKHQSRFHLHLRSAIGQYQKTLIHANEMLPFLGKLFIRHKMVKRVDAGMRFYRARVGKHPLTAKDNGPPPKELASAGRMNPAGIPYFYLAYEERTAIAEARALIARDVTLSTWRNSRELLVIDFTNQLKDISIFEGQHSALDQTVFLRYFLQEISEPLVSDEAAELSYIPTQITCEFLAQVFQYKKQKMDGLIYTSSITGGKNLVLFPELSKRGAKNSIRRFGMAEFCSAFIVQP